MPKGEGNPRKSILCEVESVINGKLGVNYQHRESCLKLSKEPVSNLDGTALIKAIYDKVE